MPRWRFVVYGTLETLTFEVNPNEGGTPTLQKNITQQGTSAGNRQLLFEGADSAPVIEFSGVLLSQSQLEAMTTWFYKRQLLLLEDDLERTQVIYITDFSATRKRSRRVYRHEWRMRAIVVTHIVTHKVYEPASLALPELADFAEIAQ